MTKITPAPHGSAPATPTERPWRRRAWLTGPQNQRIALAAGPAQGRDAITGAAAGQFQGYMQRDPGSRHADGMPHGDCAAVDVDDPGIQTEFAGRGQCHRRERLVDLHDVELVNGDALTVECLLDR